MNLDGDEIVKPPVVAALTNRLMQKNKNSLNLKNLKKVHDTGNHTLGSFQANLPYHNDSLNTDRNHESFHRKVPFHFAPHIDSKEGNNEFRITKQSNMLSHKKSKHFSISSTKDLKTTSLEKIVKDKKSVSKLVMPSLYEKKPL
jgi:hypothetical protein